MKNQILKITFLFSLAAGFCMSDIAFADCKSANQDFVTKLDQYRGTQTGGMAAAQSGQLSADGYTQQETELRNAASQLISSGCNLAPQFQPNFSADSDPKLGTQGWGGFFGNGTIAKSTTAPPAPGDTPMVNDPYQPHEENVIQHSCTDQSC